jgi:hypothetical protein
MDMKILAALFGLSCALNAYLLARRPLKQERQLSIDARALLHDWTSGQVLIHIKRVDPNEVYFRSPKELG